MSADSLEAIERREKYLAWTRALLQQDVAAHPSTEQAQRQLLTRLREDVLEREQRLLRALGFDAACADAQVPLLNALRAFDAPRSLYELCVALLNDGSHSLACAGVPSRLRVAAAISVGIIANSSPQMASFAVGG